METRFPGYKDLPPEAVTGPVNPKLLILYEISNAMLGTFYLPEILYIILTAITAREGLGFNRAALFLLDDTEQVLEGRMGIGPFTGEEAHEIWRSIEQQKLDLRSFINAYQHFAQQRDRQSLNNVVKSLRLPLRTDSGAIAVAALEGRTITVGGNEEIAPEDRRLSRALRTTHFAVIPLIAHRRPIGAIWVDNKYSGRPIETGDLAILSLFANQAIRLRWPSTIPGFSPASGNRPTPTP
jgi:GAF domain-containing protein